MQEGGKRKTNENRGSVEKQARHVSDPNKRSRVEEKSGFRWSGTGDMRKPLKRIPLPERGWKQQSKK